ncbi:hypothetical protein V6N13_143432 [Hibiscus sabdariffa]|uniref:RNase H type-1 domain-containing protein n=1 Tax=Hibiscus sabdariffa TaxID=183260 RepID=A0ABR2FHA9_9ROSI
MYTSKRLCGECCSALQHRQTAASSSPTRVVWGVCWSRPDEGWVKVNSDGTVGKESRVAYATGFVRDHRQWVIDNARKIGRRSVVEAEIWGTYDGLQRTWALGLRMVVLELDRLVLVKALIGDGVAGKTK